MFFNKKNKLYFILIVALLAGIVFFIYKDGLQAIGNIKMRQVTPRPDAFSTEEQNTINVFNMASPSVVFITNKKLQRDRFSLDVFKRPQGSGSGFVWDDNGHVVTNFHVVYNASEVDVTFHDGSVWSAIPVGVDPDHDIAVLKIDAPKSKLAPVIVGSSNDLQVGQKVLAIGNPFGLDSTITTGIISALGRSIEAMTGRTIFDVIQTDAAINPGNSGGPLLDSFGRLLGINTSIISTSGSNAGIGFAVPVNTVNRIVSELIVRGKVDRPGLGITLIPDNFAARLRLEGVCVLEVFPNGPAQKAGLIGTRQYRDGSLVKGDIIISIEGARINNAEDLIKELSRYNVGDTITVRFLRNNVEMESTITLEPVARN